MSEGDVNRRGAGLAKLIGDIHDRRICIILLYSVRKFRKTLTEEQNKVVDEIVPDLASALDVSEEKLAFSEPSGRDLPET